MPTGEALARQFAERHPEAAAAALEGQSAEDIAATLAALDEAVAMALIRCLPRPVAANALERLPPGRASAILEHLPLRDALDIVARAPGSVRAACLAGVSPRRAAALNHGMERLADTVAEVMEVQVASLGADATVGEAQQMLAQVREDPGCHLHVTDAAGRLLGALSLRELYRAHPGSRLGSLPLRPIARLPADARIAGIADHSAWLQFTRLPVVDGSGRLVGVIRRDQLRERAPATPRPAGDGVLGMLIALLEGYASANIAVVDLFLRGGARRD